MTEYFDALVIGGGPAGATSALLLARAGWKVLVLERTNFPRRKVCGEYLSATNWPLLRRLGVAENIMDLAGPEVREVGLFAATSTSRSALPRTRPGKFGWGRALGREHLDSLLLAEAAKQGVVVRQPWTILECKRAGDGFFNVLARCLRAAGLNSPVRGRATVGSSGQETDSQLGLMTAWIRAKLVIAAHGSWGPAPSLPPSRPSPLVGEGWVARRRAHDLLGFKAHFQESGLPAGLMPLFTFPGGYGGMVYSDSGRVSLSCCVRRDWLERIRGGTAEAASEALIEHICGSCVGVRQALVGAIQDGAWLSAGPIRPGLRLRTAAGIFAVGNAAGEAHPVIAEGITMALQSAWLLTERLIAWRRSRAHREALNAVAADYHAAYRRAFERRILASFVIAHWAMRPSAVAGVFPVVRAFPSLLTWAAARTGKTKRIC